MAEIIKVFRENIPTMRFIGKKYDSFGHWGEWWQNGWFDLLEQTNEVHDTSACKQKFAEVGMKIWQDENGAVWSFENCLCPRYTTPDDNGNVILDYCYFVTK